MNFPPFIWYCLITRWYQKANQKRKWKKGGQSNGQQAKQWFVHKILHWRLNIEKHKPNLKFGVNYPFFVYDLSLWFGLGLWCFSYIVAINFISGGNQSTRRKPPTCRKSLTTFSAQSCTEYTSPWAGFELTTLVVISTEYTSPWAGFELTTLVVIDTCCKYNYRTITTMTVQIFT